ncbi:MAG: uroporphyrinogen decarboxylase [SAR86 cluster bacterium]|nr:uroporphyrinogen decarboxylase [Gammaproteobacteria bacterium]MDO7562084.1 uroporphyrinogen decarboxylase [SAR86 cluster bacterium]MDO7600795.1 uroporphyrinogen decarboxylase [SAR86 cluster bacterium]MDO7676712.1 uroporphyrinogen decarboxylase [Gammaproteobacteria bacterium]MDO7709864.1 uroporphyrinogen decarboxylase [Gammaproteobacteria bacterium]
MNNSPFLKALRREQNDVPPIWFMRQAGRYLPEYQKIRRNYKNFLDMCKEPRTCAELALQPIERFDLDASILFSDILTIPDAFNLGLAFHEGEGPKFSNPISTPQDIARLEDFEIEKLSYVYKAIEETKKILPATLPLIGFCGSPWTLAAYSIEGGGSKDFAKTKKFISDHPEAVKDYLEIITDACFQYLKQQVLSGVNALQIFDSWADLLNPNDLETYSLEYTRKLARKLKQDVVTSNTPIILFEKAPQKKISDILFEDLSCISLHWSESIERVSENLKGQFAIQGNLNPSFLLESDEIIQAETKKICDAMKNFPGFIFNLGHGITPDIKPEKVQVMVDAVRT